MGTYKTKYNPFSKSLQYVLDATLLKIKGTVDTVNDLPLTGNSENDCYIVEDVDRLYTWGISSPSGLITDWKDVGSTTEIDWSGITNKPSSSVADIDDAVSKKHSQGTDTTLGAMTEDLDMNNHSIVNLKDNSIQFNSGGEINRTDYLDSISKKHTQNTDTKLDEGGSNEVSASEVVKNIYNVVILAFKLAIQSSLTIFNMVDGIIDEYEDESGIDTVSSSFQNYNAVGKYYETIEIIVSESPYAHYKCNDNTGNTTVTDDGTGSNNGTSSTNTSNLSATGKINNCFEFDSDNSEYVNIDALEQDIDSDTTGSISVWFNIADLSAHRTIFSLGDTNAENYFFIRAHDSGYIQVFFQKQSSTPWSFLSTETSISTGTWYHLVLVQNGTTPVLYINGSEETISFDDESDKTVWFSELEDEFDNGRLGCNNFSGGGNQGFMDGKIDDFRYYQNKALSLNDISAIYNFGSGTEDDKPSLPTQDMTLISESFTADSEPNNARIIIREEDVNPITLNTDLKARISKDDGDTWVEATLIDEGDYDDTKRVLVGSVDLTQSGIGSGTDMKYELTTDNGKNLKIHGTALLWDN